MELRHIRHFLAVAEELHFGRAAQRLNMAQPPLSQSIQALEADLGVTLFARTRRRVQLTEAGAVFLEEARRTMAQADHARRMVQAAGRGDIGRLEIGFTGSSPFNNAMARIIGAYRRAWPGVWLSLRELSTTDQMRALQEGRLDVGFVRPARGLLAEGLASEQILMEPLRLVLNADHPLAAQGDVNLADLADEPFIMHPRQIGTGLHDKAMALCRDAGFTPRVVLEAHQMSTIVSLAAAGLGVSIVPDAMRRVSIDNMALLPIAHPDATMDLSIATRADDQRPAVVRFLDEARRVKEKL